MVFGIIVLGVVVASIAGTFVFLKKSSVVSDPATVPEKPVAQASPPPAVKPPEETTTNGFSISAFKLEKTPGTSLVYVVGTVRNLTDKQRFGVKAEFSLLDTNGASTGTASDYAATLAAHEVWKFKALVMESKVVEARLEAVREDQ